MGSLEGAKNIPASPDLFSSDALKETTKPFIERINEWERSMERTVKTVAELHADVIALKRAPEASKDLIKEKEVALKQTVVELIGSIRSFAPELYQQIQQEEVSDVGVSSSPAQTDIEFTVGGLKHNFSQLRNTSDKPKKYFYTFDGQRLY